MATVAPPAGAPRVACPHCRQPLDRDRMSPGLQTCPRCRRAFEAVLFTPPERRVRVAEVGASGPGGATACAVHKRNAAVDHCGRCGLFICALCRVEADRQVLCTSCFDRLSAEGALDTARVRFRDYAGLAVAFGVLGLGPLAVYYGVRSLRQKDEMGELGGRAGTYAAIGLGSLESLGALVLLFSLVR